MGHVVIFDENQKLTSWIYNLNKEKLIWQLEKSNLSTQRHFPTLRERMVKAVKYNRDTRAPFKSSLTLPCDESSQIEETYSNHSGSLNSFHDENSNDTPVQLRIERVIAASQTDLPFSYSEMIGDPISGKKLQNKRDAISKESSRVRN